MQQIDWHNCLLNPRLDYELYIHRPCQNCVRNKAGRTAPIRRIQTEIDDRVGEERRKREEVRL